MKLYPEIAKKLKNINAEIEGTIPMPVTKGTKVKEYENRIKGLIEKVRILRSTKNPILDELDLLFVKDETKFDRGLHLWLTAFKTAFEQVCFNFQDCSLSQDTVNNNTKLFRSFMQVKAKVDYDENLNIKIEELGIYYAYTLNELQEKIEKRALELKNPTRYFYNFNYHAVINTDQSTMGKRNHTELLHIFNDNSFQTQIKETEPLQIKDKLEFHLRNFQRNGGNKLDWIIHTKALRPSSFTPEQKDAFLTWIEDNEETQALSTNTSKSTPVNNKKLLTYNWTGKPQNLTVLHKAMKGDFIVKETNVKDFCSIFENKNIVGINPVKWKRTATDLLQLLYEMMKKGLIIDERKRMNYKRLKACFCKEDGSQFSEAFRSIFEQIKKDYTPEKTNIKNLLTNLK